MPGNAKGASLSCLLPWKLLELSSRVSLEFGDRERYVQGLSSSKTIFSDMGV